MNKIMSDDKTKESVDTGSSQDPVEGKADPNDYGEGKGQSAQKKDSSTQKKSSEETIPKNQFQNLEKKLGEQGEELHKYRSYIEEITPLLEKLEKQPEIVQAILSNKIDSELAKAVNEGKVTLEDAEKVTKAHKEVKKDLGEKKYEKTKPEDIENLVEEKLNKKTGDIEKKLSSIKTDVDKQLTTERKIRDHEKKIEGFIKRTSDFEELADDINKYLDEHSNVDDIEVAYDAVKGRRLAKEKAEALEKQKAEMAKGVAANAQGGSSRSTTLKEPEDTEKFISGPGSQDNPNL